MRTWPKPTNQTELRRLLSLANYYRRFVNDFAKICSRPHKLIERQAKKNFKLEEAHDEAFKGLKRMLYSAPILALSNFESDAPPLVLHTDASDIDVDGVLSQRDKEAKE
ncbi:Retrovirus-related Pol polyprotein [Echinococcus granulosus]|uniref:Retrotransposable element Tf2 155 kDa protein n=1 Tax=Echinococcus granulosus TaxID=6210 RepID=U6JN00_ECHGR|nr:Retrovirus-related Pol polyprotein [Echinococcus granulosus]EUB59227.1 Retrovirus-related Pol polyprotein [Echinococcus granulosus]CDS23201.1 retrotransposable element Tf2 155 kDa protein [Echinococcus granulosus]